MWLSQTVSVVLPAFNERENIYRAVKEFRFTGGIVDEIIVVDNNSTDSTAEYALQAGARVVRAYTQGYGAALRCGIGAATGDLIVLAEPDGTFKASDLYKLLAYIQDCDMVCGTRTNPLFIHPDANMGRFLRWGNILVAKLINEFTDCGCTFRVIRRKAAIYMLRRFTVNGSHFLPEMVLLGRQAKLRMVEVPVHYRGRIGTSKITGTAIGKWKTGLKMLWLITCDAFKP